MPFNLVMKRKVFVKIQIICEEYEEKCKEKVATASVVNVLLAEALIARRLIPKDFLEQEYGSNDPILEGFTPKAKNNIKRIEAKSQLSSTVETQLRGMLEQWDDHPDPAWRLKTIAYAKKFPDLEPARLLIAKECTEKSSEEKTIPAYEGKDAEIDIESPGPADEEES